jgi:hypothetical protein
MNPDQRSERRSLRVWRKLRGWFRNLSNPKKAASVAGGVATTLAIITGLITVGEKLNGAVRAGGDAKTETAVPPLPQYHKTEVQRAIEKQQEAVQEYAYPYTPPEQLKASGEDGAAGAGEDVEEHPIRANYIYLGGYSEGVIVGKFDPVRDSAIDPDEGHVALSYPQVWVDVTSLAEFETVTLSPYLVVEVTDVRPMPDRVNYVVFPTGGAGGEIRYFVATLSPERTGVLYAPQWTPETDLGPYPRPTKKTYPFFTLTPGEKELVFLDITMLPDYFYYFRVGVQYSYKGRQGIHWSKQEFVAGVPLEAEVWWLSEDGSRLQKFGDLQDYKEHLQRGGGPNYR